MADTAIKTMDDYPTIGEFVVRHGLFWYYKPEETVINGEERVILVQHTAFAGDTVELHLNSDLERAKKYGALHDEETSAAMLGQQAQTTATIEPESDEVEVSDLTDEEMVEWLMSAGVFDGEKKPNATEVIQAAGGDKELAERLLEAEKSATGNEPRQAVVAGLQKVIDR